MTTTRQQPTETPHHASYAALRARLDEQIKREKQAGATLADPAWEAPRCVLGHVAATPDACPRCIAERSSR